MSDAQIGSLLIALEANTAKLDDQIKTSKQGMVDFKSSIDAVGAALSAVGAYEIFKEIIDATAEAEKAQALLASQVKATGDASGLSMQQLTDMAETFGHSTTSSKEQVEQLEAELMAFRNIGPTVFQGAIQAALDFSSVTGRDAAQAIKTLGVALNDPINGLTRLRQAGIDLSDGMKNTIKTMAEEGDLVGAQNALLQEMEKSYGGAAAAARDVLGGALAGLKNDFKDIIADGSGAPALTQAINDLDKALQDPDVKTGLDALVSGFLRFATIVAEATVGIANFATAVGESIARAVGYTGNFDDQIKSLNTKIFDTSTLLSEAFKADPSGQSEAIKELSRQLAQYKYQLQDVELYQQAITGKSATPTITLAATDITPEIPDLPKLPDVKEDHSQAFSEASRQYVENQKQVMQAWKAINPSAYLDEEITKTQLLVGTVVDGQIFTATDADMRMQQLQEDWKRHNDAMMEMTQSAAQGMQQDLQQFFFDPFNEGLGGLLKAFINTIQEMLAQWAATAVFNAAFGSFDASGQGKGAAGFGDLLNGAIGGHRAGGGPVTAGTLYQVNENGIEGFLPSSGGSVVPLGPTQSSQNGGISVGYNIHVGGGGGDTAAQMMQFAPLFRRQIQSDIQYWVRRGAWPV